MLKRYALKLKNQREINYQFLYHPHNANIEIFEFFNDFLRKADCENKEIV